MNLLLGNVLWLTGTLSISLSLGKFVAVTNPFYENNSTITLCCERNNCVIDDKKRRVCQNANIILMILQFETIQ